MNYGSCAVCGKLTSYNAVRVCLDCKEEILENVKKYLKENGETKIDEICHELNIPKRLIVEFVTGGVLEASNFDANEIEDLLDKERKRFLAANFSSMSRSSSESEPQKQEIKTESKMRFLNRRR